MNNITTFNFSDLERFDKIFCLVSGGIDSTYLWEMVKHLPQAIPVNCWNPYEQNDTLKQLRKHPRFVEVRPVSEMDYRRVLVDAFKKIPEAYKLRRAGRYDKKIFPCCKFIKHQAFMADPTFTEPNTVVISGIKAGDGQQRAFWLKDLRRGEPGNRGQPTKPTYFYRHKGGQLYCYPFRDYRKRELPRNVLAKLRETYPTLKHSGCAICPVLVVFNIRSEGKRYRDSVRFWHQLSGQPDLDQWGAGEQ